MAVRAEGNVTISVKIIRIAPDAVCLETRPR